MQDFTSYKLQLFSDQQLVSLPGSAARHQLPVKSPHQAVVHITQLPLKPHVVFFTLLFV